MNDRKPSRWTLRPKFLLGIGVILLVLIGYPIYVMSTMQGGRIVLSPDGTARLSVYGPMDPQKGDSYQVHLDEIDNGAARRLLKLTIQPVASRIVAARGQDSLIQWSPDSDYADIVVEGERLVRVFVPGTEAAKAAPPRNASPKAEPEVDLPTQ